MRTIADFLQLQRRWAIRSLLAAAMMVLTTNSQAAPLHYDEAIDGAFDGVDGTRDDNLVLDFGINTILGGLSFDGSAGDKWDSFRMVIPESSSITRITFNLYNITHDPDPFFNFVSASSELFLRSTLIDQEVVSLGVLAPNPVPPSTLPVSFYGAFLPLVADYSDCASPFLPNYLCAPGITLFGNGLQPTSFSYAYAIEVSAVPVPAALPLFAGGLGLLGFLGWRRNRSATQSSTANPNLCEEL